MTGFKKCDRCCSLWTDKAYFGSIHVSGKEHRGWLRLCPNCMGELLWFLDHPEADKEGE